MSRRRFWTRSRRRILGLSAALLGLIASMVWTVRRQSQAREVALAIDSLESVEVIERVRYAKAMRRTDSLASRGRLLEAAGELGLRPASDEEISFIEDIEDVSSSAQRTSASEASDRR